MTTATFDSHPNFGYSLVATAPTPATSGTSLVVTAATGTRFPTPGSSGGYNATVWPASQMPTPANSEIVRITAVSTDTLTITRTSESTGARAIVVGDQIAIAVTAKALTDLETPLNAHTSNVTNPHATTAAQVGLGNVTNDAQVKLSDKDTDGTLAANADARVASQRATKTYVDTSLAALPTAASSDNAKMSISTVGTTTTFDVTNVPLLGDTPHMVRAVAAAALPANTYANGTSGVGATLTATANGALAAVDGVTLIANDELLVTAEASTLKNGRYVVTTVGDASNPYKLTRVAGADQPGELLAGRNIVVAREGTNNAGVQWWLTADVTTVGTTGVLYAAMPLGDSHVRGGNLLGLGNITFNGDTSITRTATAGVVQSTAWSTAGLTGVANASRWIGATTSGAPTSGSWLVGDFVIDQTSNLWVCTVAGTPGTWVNSRNPRVTSTASSGVPTPNVDTTDLYLLTAQAAAATFGAPTGTARDGQKLMIRIKDNATAQTLAWNAAYRASSDLALPTTTIISKTLYLGFVYNAADTKWDLLALLNNF